ncbi:metal ABC transporter permease [Actinomadura vinacea]|uniref:metal ABC transporter permease n=1 Tax=Actinomadura vinacea TaxID=115336 RepID=UPI003CD07C90
MELILTGMVCGVLGVQAVLRRLAYFTEALGHVAFLGIVAAVAGADVKIGAELAAVGRSWSLAVAASPPGGIISTPVSWSAALALGVVLSRPSPVSAKTRPQSRRGTAHGRHRRHRRGGRGRRPPPRRPGARTQGAGARRLRARPRCAHSDTAPTASTAGCWPCSPSRS